ncbi:MAG: ThiF family adenylyltransferase [Elusimicrobiota bacterium]
MAADLSRYGTQMLFKPLGESGQARVLAGRVCVIGLGALGSGAADILARAGVGHLRLVDRDSVETGDLQRQLLYEERDAGAPKADAALRRLRGVNSGIRIEAENADVSRSNVERILSGMHVVVDGTDNFETRFLINDACLKLRIPWVYGGCAGSCGTVAVFRPGKGPCLRCVLDAPPPKEFSPTCHTVGLLASASAAVSAWEAVEALKMLSGRDEAVLQGLHSFDVWTRQWHPAATTRRPDCPACVQGRYDYLTG